ncbi:MAG TPA: protein kinase [Thermoanaerobaculia bacterium]|nr:protein kinase [Thermoanaerobaculia bacterium]
MRFAPGSRLGAYEIEAPLGEGGMGEVYRATDKRLGRKVAIKILSGRLTENRRASSRFEREARAVAAIAHPNILSIYEFEAEGDTPFVVTELLEGTTLRERMATRIPWQKAAEIGAAIADGLAAAHARGITHRDLKPENVFLTNDGRVKILDFGIAHMKRGAEAGLPSDTEPTAEYRADAPLGTVGYVSPEQIRCEEPASTSDLFSLGVILYEMCAGVNPFARGTALETLAAILNDEPAPLRHVRDGVPPAVEHLVHRCLQKNPEERFQSSRDLADQLRQAVRGNHAAPAPAHKVRRTLIATAATIAIALAALFYFNERPGFALGGSATQGATTLAILPLVNATGDPALDYLADGITESLINQLSELPNLRVTARPTVFQFKGDETDPIQVGKQLAVGAIATGKVAMRGETLQIQADLIDTSSGAQVWGGTFDSAKSETAAVPGRVARDIARELELKLTRSQRKRIALGEAIDPAAFDLYLRGREAFNRETSEGRQEAIALLSRAVKADPRFARAHAALGEAYVRYSTTAEPSQMFAKARASIARALEIDPNLAEAHLALGIVLFWSEWDFAGAEREYRKSLQLSPSLAAASAHYAELLLCRGDFEEAIRQAQRARELDPLSRATAIALASSYIYAGRYERARAELTNLLRTDPDYPAAHMLMGRVLHLTGDLEGACAEYVTSDALAALPEPLVEKRRDACRRGKVDAYNREVIRAMKEDPGADPYHIAALHAEIGERSEPIRYLRIAFRERATGMLLIRSDPGFADLRNDPEFIELAERVGFPPARRASATAASAP